MRGENTQPKVKTASKKGKNKHSEEEGLPSPRRAKKDSQRDRYDKHDAGNGMIAVCHRHDCVDGCGWMHDSSWLVPAQYAVVQVAKTVVEKGSKLRCERRCCVLDVGRLSCVHPCRC